LRIDCNEIGFSRRNAEAICKIGKSTKAGLDKSTRYIGEKGIGFKSVFKIADVVWIQSGHYSFKFDKYAKLGMIAPIWTPFPYQPKAGYTSMYLQLAEDCNTSELVNDVKSLDPRLLIFLRKLREINITVQQMPFAMWKTTLRCQDVEAKEGEELVSLLQNGDSRSYKIIRHPISGLPPEPKRPDCHESEILLAFPLDKLSEPLIVSQNVYAFLPIRDYGFKVRKFRLTKIECPLSYLVFDPSRLSFDRKPRRYRLLFAVEPGTTAKHSQCFPPSSHRFQFWRPPIYLDQISPKKITVTGLFLLARSSNHPSISRFANYRVSERRAHGPV
jgi:hypothetical protein